MPRKAGKFRRTFNTIAALCAVLVVLAIFGFHFATKALKHQVEQALGSDSEVGEIIVGWSSIEVRDVRIHAPSGWPAADTLRARRVVVVPDLLGLISAKIHIRSITVSDAYISVLRTRDGRLRLLPSLLEKPASADTRASTPAVAIGTIELHNGALEFFDASVSQPAHQLHLEQMQATIGGLQLPALTSHTTMQLNGVIKGKQRDGKLSLHGWVELANKNSELTTELRGVDMLVLQPYLLKASETGVRHGTLDLTLKSTVNGNHLHAPGTVTLTGLELISGGGPLSTFMGVPRQAILTALKDRNDQITVPFTLEGNLSDPQFSLNDSFSKRIGTSVAGVLGVNIEGLTRNVGKAAEGLGNTVKRLFGK